MEIGTLIKRKYFTYTSDLTFMVISEMDKIDDILEFNVYDRDSYNRQEIRKFLISKGIKENDYVLNRVFPKDLPENFNKKK